MGWIWTGWIPLYFNSLNCARELIEKHPLGFVCFKDGLSVHPCPTPQSQVVTLIVSLIFQMPGLKWDSPVDHTELFSGCMTVTQGEIQAVLPVMVLKECWFQSKNKMESCAIGAL